MSFWKSAWNWATGSSISSTLAKTALLGYSVKLLNDNINESSLNRPEPVDPGVRQQLNPNTETKLPVLYGSAFFGGNIVDAHLSSDLRVMKYVLALNEITSSTTLQGANVNYVFDDVYLNNNRVIFKADGITVDYTLDRSGNQDVSFRDLVKIYMYTPGPKQPAGYSGTTPASDQVMPTWTAVTHPMTGLAYAIVEVTYNRSKNVTGLPDCVFHLTNSMTLPGDVLYDYMTNARYGAGIPVEEIDTSSLNQLNNFALQGFSYETAAGQADTGRVDINGLVDTATITLDNMEELAKAGGAWLNYDIHSGRWGAIINRAFTVNDTIVSLDDSNILGEIAISGTSLTQLNNIADVRFQNANVLDKPDYVKISLPEEDLLPNEPRTSLQLSLPFTNKQAVALKLGLQLLKQARVDKIISFTTDYSWINLRAGTLVKVTSDVFGFNEKVFRIITSEESEGEEGEIQIEFTCLEYSAGVYEFDIQEFAVETDDGILNIGSIGRPGTPQISKFEISARPRIQIESTTPTGVVEGLEFWISNDVALDEAQRSYRLIGTRVPADAGTFPQGTNVIFEYDALSTGDFVVKTRGFNAIVFGQFSDPSGFIEYRPQQTTDALGPNSGLTDSFGNVLTALALIDLLRGLDELYQGISGNDSLFKKIFETFEEVTGVDILGDAESGELVVASDLSISFNGGQLTNNTSNINFTGAVDVSTVGANQVTVEIKGFDFEGDPNKGQTIAWDGEKWAVVDSCCEVVFPEPPPGPVKCLLDVIAYYPTDRTTFLDPINTALSDQAPITGNYYMVFGNKTFYGALSKGTGSIKLYKSNGTLVETVSASSLEITNNVVGIPFAPRELGTDYYILMDEGVVTYCGCVSREIALPTPWNFNTPLFETDEYNVKDIAFEQSPIPEVLSYNPSGNEVCPNSQLSISWDKEITKGAGNAYIRLKSNNSIVATIPVSQATVSGSTINFGAITSFVQLDTEYYITADAGIVKSLGDCHPGLPSKEIIAGNLLTFKIINQLQFVRFSVNSDPILNDTTFTKANPQTNIELIFNKNISLGTTGTITIHNSNGSVYQSIPVTTNFNSNKTSELIWTSQNKLILNPTKDFTPGSTYYVLSTPLTVRDGCGLTWSGTTNVNLIRFTVDSGPSTNINLGFR